MESAPELGVLPPTKGLAAPSASFAEQEVVLAALDAAFDLHLTGAPAPQIAEALRHLREVAKSHFEGHDRNFAAIRQVHAPEHIKRHGSLIRYIDHAIANIGQWSPSQRYIHLRFMSHSITAQFNELSVSDDPDANV